MLSLRKIQTAGALERPHGSLATAAFGKGNILLEKFGGNLHLQDEALVSLGIAKTTQISEVFEFCKSKTGS